MGEMNIGSSRDSIRPESYYQLVEDVQDFAIFILDAEGTVQTWNVGAERVFGFTEDEITGQNFSRLFLEEDVRSGVPQHELQQAAEGRRAGDNRWLVRKNGRRIWVEGCLVAIKESGCFGKIVRDQTTAKNATEQIHHVNVQLQEKIHELEQFAEVVVNRELKMMAYEKERDTLIAENQRLQEALKNQIKNVYDDT
jgi:PAS domain S-box-containing protein